MVRPKSFYKFCTARVAKLNLKTQRLRFSSPLYFNDPFDCYFPPGISNLKNAVLVLQKRFDGILAGKEQLPDHSLAAFTLAPIIGLADTVPPEVAEHARMSHKANIVAVASNYNQQLELDWENKLRRFRLLSLCAERNNPLLWSHYADSHRGVAFEFDASCTKNTSFQIAKPVKYQKRAPRIISRKVFIESVIGLADQPDVGTYPLILTKSVEWSYEKEWRIVLMTEEGEKSLYSDLMFFPGSLRKIFLGCRNSIRDQRAIERLATGDFAHVEIHRARQSRSNFGLKFDRIR